MYQWQVEYNTEMLNLFNNNNKWILTQVTGTSPAAATINESTIVGADGVRTTGKKTNKRNLVFTLHIRGDCERNREELYDIFTPKNEIRLYCTTTRKKVYIDGIVESNECDPYTNDQIMQISVLCPYPYFKDAIDRTTDNSIESNGFTFPFQVEYDESFIFGEMALDNSCILYNYGKIKTGITIDITLLSNYSSIKIYNYDNANEYIGFNHTFLADDIIHINTNQGAIDRATITRNGVTSNLLSKLMNGSTWIKLDTTVKVLTCYPENSMFVIYNNRDEVVAL